MLFYLSLSLAELIPNTKDVLVFFYNENNLVNVKLMSAWIEFKS